MAKKNMLSALILGTSFILSMDKGNGIDPEIIKCHIFNRVTNAPLFVSCEKYWIHKKKNISAFYATVARYKTESLYTTEQLSQPFNLRPDTFGILEVKDALYTEKTPTLLYITYCWNSDMQKLSFHIDELKFRDRKTFNIHTGDLKAHCIGLVFAGDGLENSYIFYPGMPENKEGQK